jgi:hypothetical protein
LGAVLQTGFFNGTTFRYGFDSSARTLVSQQTEPKKSVWTEVTISSIAERNELKRPVSAVALRLKPDAAFTIVLLLIKETV